MPNSPHPAPISPPERPLKQAMLRGARRRCPACGEGHLFSGYLTVKDRCESCGEDLHHHRADDGPAYLTLLLVSHIGASAMLAVFIAWRPSPATLLAIFGIGAIVMTLALLPVIKGGFVGFQWARRMHGFDSTSPNSIGGVSGSGAARPSQNEPGRTV